MKINYIQRPIYTNRIRPFIGKQIIKVLTGQRRVGKSYIMLQLIDEIKLKNQNANIIFINKELQQFSEIRNSNDLYQYVENNLITNKQNYLFVDEIQEIESFELCLRSLLAENKCDIFCTGSNAKMLSGELATSLSGRYVEFVIHSLSYLEFLLFNELENNNEALTKFLTLGGMPYLKNIQLETATVFEYLKNVYATILLKDVVARENIRNVSFLENLVAFLIDNTGSLVSAQNISKYLKSQHLNIPTQSVLNYLKALCNAYFIHKVQRAEVNGLKIFEIGEKYYFEDTGLRNSIRNFEFKNEVNKLMENAVYLNLLINNYTVYVGKVSDKEIDFVAEKNGSKIYIQVAYMLSEEATIQREYGNLMQVADNYPKYVVTLDELFVNTNYKGIIHIHLRDFLTMEI